MSQKPVFTIAVDGMSCASCAARAERALQGVEGVETARVDITTGAARIEGSPTAASVASTLPGASREYRL